MAQLMTPAIRKVLYNAKLANDLDDLAQRVSMPESPASAISSIRNEMASTIADLQKLGLSKLNAVKAWTSITSGNSRSGGCGGVSHKYDSSVLHFSRTLGTASSRLSKMQKASQSSQKDILDNLKKAGIAAATQFAEMEIRRVQTTYRAKIDVYKKAVQTVKDSYSGGGKGRKEVDYRCDCIDRYYDECCTIAKKIAEHITQMGVRAPIPGAVGTCTTNPAYAAVTLLIDICEVLSLIVRMAKLILAIKSDIDYFFGMLDITQLDGLSSLLAQLKQMQENMNATVESAVEAQKNMLTPVYSLKYNSTTMKWEEDTLNGKIRGYKRPSKINMSREDINGVSMITNISIETYEIYNDALGTDKIGDSVDGYIYDDGSVKSEATASVSVTADGKRSILHLSDGRKVTIDKIVSIGDVVKLNDGTIINIGN